MIRIAAVAVIIGLLGSASGRPAGDAPGPETLPAGRGGQDLVGRRFRKPDFDRWIDTGVETPAAPAATLYRWWTDACPYCRASLPAVEHLRREFGPHGLDVVGVYHPKPPRAVTDGDVRAAARRLGFGGRVAVDADWSALRHAWLSTGDRRATSVTFLVDADGVIRFLHPGPVFFPSDDPEFAVADDDYQKLRNAIAAVLREQPDPPSPPKEQPR